MRLMDYPSFWVETEHLRRSLQALEGKVAWSGELLGKPYVFKDREHAGQLLAQLVLKDEKFRGDLVLAIPNGGIPVGVVLAVSLGLKFDLAI
ncbi:MAG: hypothetical protein DRO46_04390, partial [Candidatus Hecatellales archaeon]